MTANSGHGADPILLDLRPDRSTLMRGTLARAAIVLPLVIVFAVTRSDSAGLRWFVWGVLGAAVVVVLVFTLTVLNSRVVVTGRAVTVHRAVGGPRTLPRERITGGVLANRYRVSFNPESAMVMLVGAGRGSAAHRLLQLSGQYFSRAALHELVGVLAPTRFDIVDEPVTPAEFDRRYPGLLRLYERRPGLIVAFILVVIFGALAVWVVSATS